MRTLAPPAPPRTTEGTLRLVGFIALLALALIGWVTSDALWPSARARATWRAGPE